MLRSCCFSRDYAGLASRSRLPRPRSWAFQACSAKATALDRLHPSSQLVFRSVFLERLINFFNMSNYDYSN